MNDDINGPKIQKKIRLLAEKWSTEKEIYLPFELKDRARTRSTVHLCVTFGQSRLNDMSISTSAGGVSQTRASHVRSAVSRVGLRVL